MRYEFNILTIKEKKKWNDLIRGTEQEDVFFLPEYLQPFEDHLKAKCFLFYYGNDDDHILYPFFLIEVGWKGSDEGDPGYTDAISPWYYGGAMIHGKNSTELHTGFINNLKTYLKENNCLSIFSRSNPYIKNHEIIGSGLKERKILELIYIDLEKDMDDIWRNSFNKSARYNIKKDQKSNIEIIIDNSDKYLDVFIEKYQMEMIRKNSNPFYHFNESFFKKLREGLGNKLVLSNKYVDGIWTAGGIDLYHKDLFYGLFGVRDFNISKNSNSHIITWKLIEYGKELGLKRYDLGGGEVGSGLLEFKKSFSKDSVELWGHGEVIDRKGYRNLCKSKNIPKKKILYEKADFFPEYRKDE